MKKRDFLKKVFFGMMGLAFLPTVIKTEPKIKNKPSVTDAQRMNMAFGHSLYPIELN